MYLPHSVAGRIMSDAEWLPPRTAHMYRSAVIRREKRPEKKQRLKALPSGKEVWKPGLIGEN